MYYSPCLLQLLRLPVSPSPEPLWAITSHELAIKYLKSVKIFMLPRPLISRCYGAELLYRILSRKNESSCWGKTLPLRFISPNKLQTSRIEHMARLVNMLEPYCFCCFSFLFILRGLEVLLWTWDICGTRLLHASIMWVEKDRFLADKERDALTTSAPLCLRDKALHICTFCRWQARAVCLILSFPGTILR